MLLIMLKRKILEIIIGHYVQDKQVGIFQAFAAAYRQPPSLAMFAASGLAASRSTTTLQLARFSTARWSAVLPR
jgi:hypothetical protein